jgi:hypothetical protein
MNPLAPRTSDFRATTVIVSAETDTRDTSAARIDRESGTTPILGLVSAGILCGILAAGLWPFHAPQNDVTWLAGERGLHFGDHGTILSSGMFRLAREAREPNRSLEIWLTPGSVWKNPSTLLAFYTPQETEGFSLHQSYDALTWVSDVPIQPRQIRRARLLVDNVFHQGRSVFITIASGPQRTAVWVDGSLAQTTSPFPLAFSGSLVIANSPVTNDSWSGDLRGLAIYNSELTQQQILSHFKQWTTIGRPQLTENDHAVALYLFDEGHGSIVHNEAGSGVNLDIPQHYMVLNEKLLEPFWKEFSWDHSYWSAVLVNVAGFVPLGFFFCAYFASMRPGKRIALATIALGMAVSLMIETLQGFLPTRDSGTTDIITNTLGTCLGVALFLTTPARVLLARVLNRIPFVTAG